MAQLVEHGVGQTIVASRLHVEHNHLVAALLYPRTRHVKRLLRTNLPELAYAAAINPHGALAPTTHVEEYVATLVEFEGTAVESHALHVVVTLFGSLAARHFGELIEWKRRGGPALQFLATEIYALGDALMVVEQVGTIVYAAHVLHQYFEFGTIGYVYHHARLAETAVERPYTLAIDKDDGIIAQLAQNESALATLFNGSLIVNVAKVLSGLFHCERTFRLHAASEGGTQGHTVEQLHLCKGGHRVGSRHIGQRFAGGQVFLYNLAESIILGCGHTRLAERCIVVVAGGLWLIAATYGVGTIGIGKVRTTVEHVHINRHAMTEHPVNLLCRRAVVAV